MDTTLLCDHLFLYEAQISEHYVSEHVPNSENSDVKMYIRVFHMLWTGVRTHTSAHIQVISCCICWNEKLLDTMMWQEVTGIEIGMPRKTSESRDVERTSHKEISWEARINNRGRKLSWSARNKLRRVDALTLSGGLEPVIRSER